VQEFAQAGQGGRTQLNRQCAADLVDKVRKGHAGDGRQMLRVFNPVAELRRVGNVSLARPVEDQNLTDFPIVDSHAPAARHEMTSHGFGQELFVDTRHACKNRQPDDTHWPHSVIAN
jgi:hypothetical protein